MNRYEQFDKSMNELIKIEQELQKLISKDTVSLAQVMKLRDEATTHHTICNEILKEIKTTIK